jgi:hypothetical protein
MSTENIDDLFRRQLGGHETPPGDDLWARLPAGPGAAVDAQDATCNTPERVDQLFRERLHAHPTPPSRELWERLEDEHLRPRKRRAAAWWPLALAAAVALLLLAGGAGLWRGFPGSGTGAAGTVAQSGTSSSRKGSTGEASADEQAAARTGQTKNPSAAPAGIAARTAWPTTSAARAAAEAAANPAAARAAAEAVANPAAAASQSIARSSETTISGFSQKNLPDRATRPAGLASSASKVGMMAQQSPRRPRGASRQPDAATAPAPLVARTTAPFTTPARPRPADELAPGVAPTAPPTTIPAPEIVRPETPAPGALASNSVISVDVRSGAPKRPSLAAAVATAAASATEERRGLGGRLLRQVGHAVRGERLSLSEVTGLPENLTLEANIGGRHVSKSIQL